jgi:hypothetical protein
MRIVGFLLVVLCAVGSIWYVMTHPVASRTPLPVIEEQDVSPGETVSARTPRVSDVAWEFRLIEDGVGDPMTAPQSDIAVTFTLSTGEVKGPYRLGSFEGSCSEQSAEDVVVQGKLSRAICWFAGAVSAVPSSTPRMST